MNTPKRASLVQARLQAHGESMLRRQYFLKQEKRLKISAIPVFDPVCEGL